MITKAELKRFRSLATRKGRTETGLFLVEGVRAVEEAVRSDFELAVVVCTHARAGHPVLGMLRERHVRCEVVSEREMDALADTVQAQGIAAIAVQRHATADALLGNIPRGPALLLALDAIADPGNAGGIIRTADWFDVQGIFLGRGCVDLYNPKVVRATMGGLFRVPVAEAVDLPSVLTAATRAGYAVIAATMDGVHPAPESPDRAVLVLGNEAHGIAPEVLKVADRRVTIPRAGGAESLNVGVACGILLHVWRSAR